MDITEMTRELGKLPPAERKTALAELREELRENIVDAVLRDPERYTDESLASAYHALASGRLKGMTLEEDRGKTSQLKTSIIERLHKLLELDTEEKQAAEMRRWAADPKTFFDWVWMRDPRLDGLRDVPFDLFAVQRDIIDFIDEHRRAKRSCMIEKSRDLGVSVISVGYGCCLWLTTPGTIATYGSRKGVLVHKTGDFDSLLEKAKVLLGYLPGWAMPDGFDWGRHFNHMNVLNPATGAQMKGESGDELGRGGRATIFFADEFPKVAKQKTSHQALSGTTDCTVYFGTSAGVNTYFYQMKTRGGLPLMRVPWYHDPRKVDRPSDVGNPKADSRWKRRKLRELIGNRAAFAQEYECDDSHALESIVIAPEWVAAAIGLKLEPGSTVIAGVDVAGEGSDEAVLVTRQGGVVLPLQTWDSMQPKELAKPVHRHASARGTDHMYYDRSGIGGSFAGPIAALADSYDVEGIFGQRAASKFVRYHDDPDKPASERFANKITELWWALRLRFYRTFEVVTGKVPASTYADDELISLPDDETLVLQLSARQWFQNGRGKIQLEDKRKMTVSPDRADALALAEETILQRRAALARRSSSTSSSYETTGQTYEW